MKFRKRHTLKADYAKKEYPASEFIPYEGHWNSNTVITKDKEFITVIKLDGYSFETADDEDVDLRKTVRNTLFKSIATGRYALWIHTIRRKTKATADGEFKDYFCQYLDDEWAEKHSSDETFINELYISVIQKRDTQGAAAKILDAYKQFEQKTDKDIAEKELKESYKDIEEIISRLLGSLRDYNPKLLGIRKTEKAAFSEIFEFFGMLVNCGQYTPMLVPTTNASKYLPTERLYFGKRLMEAKSATGNSKFGACVTVREYSPFTNAGMIDTFLQLPFEFIISQSYIFTSRSSAIGQMSLQQNRMASSGDKAVSQMEELSIAMDMAQSGHIAFGKHHLSVFVFESTIKRAESAASLCYAEIVNAGVMPARESMNMQATFWAQLPANFNYIARGSVINTLNLAGFASFHNFPIGKRKNNHWGDAVTVLDTTSGTPFYFNFHVRDVGHTMIIGPTGAGKTVSMNFLMAQAQKYNPRMFFFDKDRGAEIFIRSMGGIYSVLEPSGCTNFNPLQLQDTDVNRGFIDEWLRSLITSSHNVPLTPEDTEMIADAVVGNFKLPKEERILRNIVPFFGLSGPGSLASRLKMWHTGEVRAGLFDNPEDLLDLSANRVFGFEMAPVLDDTASLGPLLLYLFHKINASLDGTPTIIILDEAWALIDNDIFAPKIKDWLKVLRKLNAMVVFATQSVEDISNSAISDTLVQQTSTQIFLANNKATEVYQDVFMLSDRELTLVKTTDPGSRFFIIKQGTDTVVARIDLSGMDKVINILSGRTETILILAEIISRVGDNPDDWLEEFWEKTC